ncbi:MAG: DJ-1/PfpI family protein [Gemmataceae bacterium]
MTALILVADGFEDLTLFLPWYRLREEGVNTQLAAPFLHAVEGAHGYQVEPDQRIDDVNPADFDLLLIPDGSSSEILRQYEGAVGIVRTFLDEGNRVATIGHGAQLLISSGALDGRPVTCAAGIRDDVRAAGGVYRDLACVTDVNLLTGRGADDLPEFMRALCRLLAGRTTSTR